MAKKPPYGRRRGYVQTLPFCFQHSHEPHVESLSLESPLGVAKGKEDVADQQCPEALRFDYGNTEVDETNDSKN